MEIGDETMWKIDLKLFFRESWKKYSFVFLLVLVQCVGFHNLLQQYNTANGREWKLHFGDYVICFFQGTLPYAQSAGKETFNIPPYWSLYMIYFVLLVGKLTGQFSKKYEQQMLLRLKSRKQWWMEMHLKIWLECIGYLAVTAIAFLVFSFCTKSAVEGINLELLKDYLGLEINKNNCHIFSMVLVFLVALLALTYIQYIVSLAINAVTGILVSIVILVSSVYQIHPFLIGNYFMGIRQIMFVMDGVGFLIQGAVSVGIISFMAVIGYQILKRKDLF